MEPSLVPVQNLEAFGAGALARRKKEKQKRSAHPPSYCLVQDDAQGADEGHGSDGDIEGSRVQQFTEPRTRNDEDGDAQAEETRHVRLLVSAVTTSHRRK